MANPVYEEEAQEETFQQTLDRESQAEAQEESYTESDWQFRVKVMNREEPKKMGKYFSQKSILMANLGPYDKYVIIQNQNLVRTLHNLAEENKEIEWLEIARDRGEELTSYLSATGGLNATYLKTLLTRAKEITRRVGDAFKPN